MSKITMQDIADAVGVSRISVWKVFNNPDSVSSSLRERVLDKASELGYEKVKEMNSDALKKKESVAVIVSRPESSAFWGSIIHSIAARLTEMGVNLLYTYVPSAYEEGYQLPDAIRHGLVSGAIVLNVYDSDLLRLINQAPTEKVFLDITSDISPSSLNGDLVLIEGRETERTITDHLIEEKGFTRLGFVGDTRYAFTNKMRYEGFVDSLRNHGLVFEQKYLMNEKIGINDYYRMISGYLESLSVFPDAFVCCSDYVASFIQEWFYENPGALDRPVILTGFDGTNEYQLVAGKITTAYVDTNELGWLLATKVLMRIGHPEKPREVSLIYPEVRIVPNNR